MGEIKKMVWADKRMLDINTAKCRKCNSKMIKVVSAGFEFYECSKTNNKNCDNNFTLLNNNESKNYG